MERLFFLSVSLKSETRAGKAHACVMLIVAFLDEPQMVWTVVLGFLLLGLVCFIEDKVHMVLLCSVTSGRFLSPPLTCLRVILSPAEDSLVYSGGKKSSVWKKFVGHLLELQYLTALLLPLLFIRESKCFASSLLHTSALISHECRQQWEELIYPAPSSKDQSAGTVNIPGAVHVYLWAFTHIWKLTKWEGRFALEAMHWIIS